MQPYTNNYALQSIVDCRLAVGKSPLGLCPVCKYVVCVLRNSISRVRTCPGQTIVYCFWLYLRFTFPVQIGPTPCVRKKVNNASMTLPCTRTYRPQSMTFSITSHSDYALFVLRESGNTIGERQRAYCKDYT